MMTIENAKIWLGYTPPAQQSPKDLVGYAFNAGGENNGKWFMCAECANKLLRRGCGWHYNESRLVWRSEISWKCNVCNKEVK